MIESMLWLGNAGGLLRFVLFRTDLRQQRRWPAMSLRLICYVLAAKSRLLRLSLRLCFPALKI